MIPAAPLYQVEIGWAGYRDPEPDEHAEALGEFPRMPEMPGEDDALPSRIHSRELFGDDVGKEIVLWRPGLWRRFIEWVRQ